MPELHPYTLSLCLAILVVVTIVNLRGTLDAGRFLALPTYLFVVSFTLLLAIGIAKTMAAGGHPQLAGPDVHEKKQTLRRQWSKDVEKPAREAGLRPPQLVLLQAPYRRI